MKRPTDRELYKRIEEAKNLLKCQPGLFVHPAKIVGELDALDIEETRELWTLIQIFLEEIKPGDYMGGYPPSKIL